MVVNNFYLEGIGLAPQEADAVLIVDADAVLAFTVLFEGL
jgi:hypothetical protein